MANWYIFVTGVGWLGTNVAYCPKLVIATTVVAGFIVYYVLEVVKRPRLACRTEGLWAKFLQEKLPILQECYWPTAWCFESRAQTIFASFLRPRRTKIRYKREVLLLSDGGEVSLDWLSNNDEDENDEKDNKNHNANDDKGNKNHNADDDKDNKNHNPNDDKDNKNHNANDDKGNKNHNANDDKGNKNHNANDDKDNKNQNPNDDKDNKNRNANDNCNKDKDNIRSRPTPIVILLPGLTGCSQSEYVKNAAVAIQRSGARCVVLNNRGMGGIKLRTARTYCAANSEDLDEAIEYIHQKNSDSPLVATGISLGGMIVGNYLVTKGIAASSRLQAALVLSIPWNVFIGTESLEKPLWNLLLNRHLANCLCATVWKLRHMLRHSDHWDFDFVMKSKTIREFDSRFTVMQFGFKDVNDYYESASLHNKLHHIKVPLFCLSAADDPFQPIQGIPISAAQESSHVAIAVTARGGHIGFMEGFIPRTTYYSDRVINNLLTAIFNNPTEMSFIKKEAEKFAHERDCDNGKECDILNGDSIDKKAGKFAHQSECGNVRECDVLNGDCINKETEYNYAYQKESMTLDGKYMTQNILTKESGRIEKEKDFIEPNHVDR